MFLETAKEVDQKFQIHFFQSFACEKHLPLTGKNICTYLLLKLVWWYQAQKSLSLLRSYAPAQWIMDLNLQHCSRPLLMTSKCKRHRAKLVVEYSYSKKTTVICECLHSFASEVKLVFWHVKVLIRLCSPNMS